MSSVCIRFNLTEKGGHDGSESDDDDRGRPSFLSIQKSSGALDKELAASGFTKKEQVEIEKVGQILVKNSYWYIAQFEDLYFAMKAEVFHFGR